MSNTALIYAAVLHIAALIALAVVLILGKATWTEVGPIMAYLVGFSAGVPVTINTKP